MLPYFRNKDEKLCCGCRACEQICPKQAISMQSNREAFLYPDLQETLCVNCGLCEDVCPMINRPEGKRFSATYAVQHKDEDILKLSSSGGVFRLLSDEVIRNGGYVVGCVWNEYYQPVLRIANSLNELIPMQGSKYLSSDTNSVYSQVKCLLEKCEMVFFTGTPCQCAGLLNFLRKPYSNLLTADFLCHGVPSQLAFDSYLDDLERKHRITNPYSEGQPADDLVKSKSKIRGITSYYFRDKEKRGWGHVSSYTWMQGGKRKKRSAVGMSDPYDFGFLNGYFNRYSCYTCPFKGEKRFTDFTFCDYWGVERYHELETRKGVSAVTINSKRGEDFVTQLKDKALWKLTNAAYVAVDNPSLLYESSEGIPAIRSSIYEMIQRKGWKWVQRKYLYPKNRLIKLIWYGLPISVTDGIKKITRRG